MNRHPPPSARKSPANFSTAISQRFPTVSLSAAIKRTPTTPASERCQVPLLQLISLSLSFQCRKTCPENATSTPFNLLFLNRRGGSHEPLFAFNFCFGDFHG